MIQLNLLPDVKQQFIKTRRNRRLITLICMISVSACLALVVLLFMTTDVWQSRSISNLDDDIKEDLTELQSVPELSKILTVQEQLSSLDFLHNDKTAGTRIFTYLPQILPEGITLSELEINDELETIEISGLTNSLETVNKFVDTLKFTNYVIFEADPDTLEVVSEDEPIAAFTEVVLKSNDIESTQVTFTIVAKFAPEILQTQVENVRLDVPQTITTRSEIEQPGALFDAPTEEEAL